MKPLHSTEKNNTEKLKICLERNSINKAITKSEKAHIHLTPSGSPSITYAFPMF